MADSNSWNRVCKLALSLAACSMLTYVALLTSGCDSGGGSGPDGQSTVQGTVDTFAAGGAFYMPREKQAPVVAWAVALLDVIVPKAQAAVPGVSVELVGTGLAGTTDDRGFFILSGAPGGDRTLRFTYNGQSADYPIRVPDNGVVTLDNVRVSNESVGVGRVSVVETPDDNGNDNRSSNANGNTNRNTNGSDDNDNENEDDDNRNINANSNVNGNANANDNDDDDDEEDDDDNGNGNRR